jgi:hypothetical protein
MGATELHLFRRLGQWLNLGKPWIQPLALGCHPLTHTSHLENFMILWNKLKSWYHNRRLTKAVTIITQYGLLPVKIVNRAGADYLVGMDGTHYRIGGKEKKK